MGNTKQQGDTGVATAAAYYTLMGFTVSQPLTDNSKYDLIVDKNGTLCRVQVKTSRFMRRNIYEVTLRTSGGNQSWNKVSKTISENDCDLVFVYTLDGKCYELPPEVFVDKKMITMGKSKEEYVVWEIQAP